MNILEENSEGKYNLLLICYRIPSEESKHVYCMCRCDCGNFKVIRRDHVVSGTTKSCGCLNKSPKSKYPKKEYKRERSSFNNMHRRCKGKYLKFGIKVCDRWSSFENFVDDMGRRPEGKTLGRIDNDGDYCKENCRWETREQQDRNRRHHVEIEWNGEKITLAEASRISGVYQRTLKKRLDRGWSIEEAMTLPVCGRRIKK
jgi:hypothetical protein